MYDKVTEEEYLGSKIKVFKLNDKVVKIEPIRKSIYENNSSQFDSLNKDIDERDQNEIFNVLGNNNL